MKFVIAAVTLTLLINVKAQLTLEQLTKLKTYREDCIKSTGVDPKVVDNARRGNIVEDPKLKEHTLCMFKKIGFVDDEGKPQRDVLRKKLVDVIKDEALANQLIEVCVLEEEKPEDTVYKSFKCFFAKTGLPVV